MFELAEKVGLGAIRRIADLWNSSRADSLIDYTAVTRVEPIALIDADCIHNEMLPDVMQSLQSIFSGYYLQALAISMNVGKIEVMRHLDKVNPSRSPMASGIDTAGWLMSAESYKHRLPKPNSNRVAIEAEQDRSEAMLSKDTLATVKDLANLSVGKMLSVEISDGAHKGTIPIAVRLMATSIPSQSIVNILASGNKDTGTVERYHAWRAGRLEFIRDLVFCQDLIDAHRKNLIKDKTGIYTEILNRRRKNQLSTLVSGNPSVATASNLLVCSNNTLDMLQGEIGGDFKNPTTRAKIFEETYLMIIAVINKEWDRVTFYHRGISTPTELGLRDLKAANKSTGPDVSEIMKAFQIGNAPLL